MRPSQSRFILRRLARAFLPTVLALAAAAPARAQVDLVVSFKENTSWASITSADDQAAARAGGAWSLTLTAMTDQLPASVNLDAIDFVSPTDVYFSLGEDCLLGGVVYADEDVIHWDGASFSMAWDGSAFGVPPGADLDALDIISVSPLEMSVSFNVDALLTVGGTPIVVADEDVVHFLTDQFTAIDFDGSAEGISANADLDAFSRVSPTRWVMSFNIPGTVGAVSYDDADLIAFDPTTHTFEGALFFDAAAAGLPPSVDLDAAEAKIAGLNTPTPSPSPSESPTPSLTPSATPSLTPSVTPSNTPSATATPIITVTPTPSPTGPVVGDLNTDGVRDAADRAIMMGILLGSVTPDQALTALADLNMDGRVDVADLTAFDSLP